MFIYTWNKCIFKINIVYIYVIYDFSSLLVYSL